MYICTYILATPHPHAIAHFYLVRTISGSESFTPAQLLNNTRFAIVIVGILIVVIAA